MRRSPVRCERRNSGLSVPLSSNSFFRPGRHFIQLSAAASCSGFSMLPNAPDASAIGLLFSFRPPLSGPRSIPWGCIIHHGARVGGPTRLTIVRLALMSRTRDHASTVAAIQQMHDFSSSPSTNKACGHNPRTELGSSSRLMRASWSDCDFVAVEMQDGQYSSRLVRGLRNLLECPEVATPGLWLPSIPNPRRQADEIGIVKHPPIRMKRTNSPARRLR